LVAGTGFSDPGLTDRWCLCAPGSKRLRSKTAIKPPPHDDNSQLTPSARSNRIFYRSQSLHDQWALAVREFHAACESI
jgi:hypothetical protein